MKKGQVYEGRIETVEFPNKGKIYLPEEEKTVIVKKRRAGTEGTLYDSEETFRKGTGTYPGGNGKITIGDKRTGMQQFSSMWWLHVSDNVL